MTLIPLCCWVGEAALRTPQPLDVEPSTYQGVGRSPWKLLIRSLRRGQLCMGGASLRALGAGSWLWGCLEPSGPCSHGGPAMLPL